MLYGMVHNIYIPPSDAVGDPSISLGSCFLKPNWSVFVSNGKNEHVTRSGDKDLKVCSMIQDFQGVGLLVSRNRPMSAAVITELTA